MIQLTLDIDTHNYKAKAFVDFIKTLDFITIKDKNKISDYSLSAKQIQTLKERKQKHLNKESKSYSWPEIKEELINSAK